LPQWTGEVQTSGGSRGHAENEAELIRMRGNLGRIGCSAYVEGKLVADAELTFALADRREQ